MTALTIPAQPRQDAAPRPLPWRRMAWVTWRQHRATLISVALLARWLCSCSSPGCGSTTTTPADRLPPVRPRLPGAEQ